MQVTKHIVGQSVFQLAVMYALVFFGDQIFGVPRAHTVHGPSQHYTLVFNAFVLMQLFNQVRVLQVAPLDTIAICSCIQYGVVSASLVLDAWDDCTITKSDAILLIMQHDKMWIDFSRKVDHNTQLLAKLCMQQGLCLCR